MTVEPPPPQDPLIDLLQRRWAMLVSAMQEVALTLPLITQELQNLRQENTQLKKTIEVKEAEIKTLANELKVTITRKEAKE